MPEEQTNAPVTNESSDIRAREIKAEPTVDLIEKVRSDLKKEIEDSRKENLTINLTVLGLFVSFITFLSIEIQILKAVSEVGLFFGLSSLSLGGILLFVVMLTNVMKDRDVWSRKLFSPLFSLSFCLIGISFICFYFSNKQEQIAVSHTLTPIANAPTSFIPSVNPGKLS